MSPAPPAVLVGRGYEMQLLGGLVERVRDQGGAMVVRGEAGIGKSALLMETSRAAAVGGMQVLTTTGVESETSLAFAGLHQLLRPVLGYVDELPGRQGDAVLAAFGMTDAPASDLFLIALATLNLLAEAASSTPVLLIVEDAHWLDRASVDVLAFVARRLDFEPVVLLAAIRDGFHGSFDDAGLPELYVDRLDDTSAAALLDSRTPDLQPGVRDRVLSESAGNPLALIELPISLGQIGEGQPPLTWLPLTTRLERAFAARVSGLPTATRTLLLVAALNDSDSLSETLAAAAVFGGGEKLGTDDLTPALAVQFIDIAGERLLFRHPLMRSAIHQRSAIAQRQAVHAALAQVLVGEADRRLWHLAAASLGRNEGVAAELEAAAGRAQHRGATVAAVAALEHAARLSEDPDRRAERLLQAAECAVELGRQDVVVRLLRAAEPLNLSRRNRARMTWIAGSFDDGIRDASGGALRLAEFAVRVAADGDTDLSLRLLWGAALRCFWAHPGPDARERIVAVAEDLPVHELDARLLAILAYAAPIERGGIVIDRMRRSAAQHSGDAQTSRLLGSAALLVGAFDLSVELSAAALVNLRAQGRLGLLARALGAQAWSAVRLVDLGVAIPPPTKPAAWPARQHSR